MTMWISGTTIRLAMIIIVLGWAVAAADVASTTLAEIVWAVSKLV